jgi:RNA polymerase sigma-70 factor (ECF subfamily)
VSWFSGRIQQDPLEPLIRQHARLWFRLAYDVLRDVHASEDVCQQAIVKVYENREQLREARQLRAWMARVVINESLLLLRKRQTERRALDHRAMTQAMVQMPDDSLLIRDQVASALSTLSEPVRVVVVLRVMEGMSGNDVKELLGYSAVQVSRLLHEGLEQLRQVLGEVSIHAEKKEASYDVR